MRHLILLFTLGAFLGVMTTSGQVVINEIDYDQVGADDAEYVELFNPGVVSVDLAGYTLELVNGSNGTLYGSFVLVGTIPAGGFYVLCTDALTVPNCDEEVLSSVQNGSPDAVGLRDGSNALVDAVSYEGDTVAPYTETTGTSAGDSNTIDLIGLSRSPAGLDTDNNDNDFSLRCSTPGEVNTLVDTGCDTLPVELGDLGARVDGSDIHIYWETLSEVDVAGFEVESKAGDRYTAEGFVAAQNSAASYAYAIEDAKPGLHTFRIRVLNQDGSSDYTGDIEVAVEVVDSYVLSSAYPNPFNPSAVFSLSLSTAQNVQIGLYDMLGRQMDSIFEGSLEADEVHQFTIRGDNLPSGMYFYRVEGELFNDMRSIVLMK